jgi:hypothetical protein
VVQLGGLVVLLVVRTDPVVELDKNEVLFADVWYGTEYTVPFSKLVALPAVREL